MNIETKIQLEQRLKNDARQRIKDRINEKMEIQIKHFQNKNKTKNVKDTSKLHTSNQGRYNNFNTMYLTKILNLILNHNI